jgi:L,D-transpeptidase ErfK/SrfK
MAQPPSGFLPLLSKLHCADPVALKTLTGIKLGPALLSMMLFQGAYTGRDMPDKTVRTGRVAPLAGTVARTSLLAAVAAIALFGALAHASDPPSGPANLLAGGEFDYVVQPGDYLIKIGARFGIAARLIAESNNIPYEAALGPGTVLRLDNRHIVPQTMEKGILINIPQRLLFYFEAGVLVGHFPVGLGRPDWRTPVGPFIVTSMQFDKVWNVPKSIREEMRRERKAVKSRIPPGPDNPLGKHWIGLSIPGIGIHSTIAPASVYHFQSHGCIRMHADDIAGLFQRVSTGTPGWIVYQPVLLAVLDDGRIFLEVHRDIYQHSPDPQLVVERLARDQSLAPWLDWRRVAEAVRRKTGLAIEVGSLNGADDELRPDARLPPITDFKHSNSPPRMPSRSASAPKRFVSNIRDAVDCAP